jgi:hypothetical protein
MMAESANESCLDASDSLEEEEEVSSFSSGGSGSIADDFDTSDESSFDEDSSLPDGSFRSLEMESDSSMDWKLEDGELAGLSEDISISPSKLAAGPIFDGENSLNTGDDDLIPPHQGKTTTSNYFSGC